MSLTKDTRSHSNPDPPSTSATEANKMIPSADLEVQQTSGEEEASSCSPSNEMKQSAHRAKQPQKLVRMIEYRKLGSNETVLKQNLDAETIYEHRLNRPGLEISEVVFTTAGKELRSENDEYGNKGTDQPLTLPPIRKRGYYTMRISSPAILNALEQVVNYYPAHTLAGQMFEINSPYSLIVHHEQQLRDYRNLLASEDPADPGHACENEDGVEMIDLLLDEVKAFHGDHVERERERYNQPIPTATFDMLWLLFEPGTDVLFDLAETNDYSPYVVKSVDFETCENRIDSSIVLFLWNLCGNNMYVGPTSTIKTIERFNGEKPITSLNPCPWHFFQGQDNKAPNEIRKSLVERGKMFYHLQTPRCMLFNGLSYVYPRRKYTGYVMVDPEERERGAISSRLDSEIPSLAGSGQNCRCQRCVKLFSGEVKKPKFAGYSKINPLKTAELTEHQYFLCDRAMYAFVFKLRQWVLLDVAGFSDAEFHNEMLGDLILPAEQKHMIERLSKTYMHNLIEKDAGRTSTWFSDPLEERGQGLIFLLHGGPGVGKTYTAECIAQRLSRPLMVLTVADIGTVPSEIEENLDRNFKISRGWNTILLIDEADIYVEERQIVDLNRNAIVAAFLRALEYYDGILFLTTNRVATFDDAILSRVHLTVGYPDFSDKTRAQLWETLFRRLRSDHEDTLRVRRDAQSYVHEDKEILDLQWNGREIRNAFQTAVALAISDDQKDKDGLIVIEQEHFKSIVKMSRAFKDYLSNFFPGKSEAQVAFMKGKR